MNTFYTDLAMESGRVGQGLDAPGIRVARERLGEVERVRVDVLDEEGAREVGKRPGTYTTLYSPAPESGEAWDRLRDTLAEEVRLLGGLDDDMQGSVLVVGLGNRRATPDAVGPRAVDRILCTRALKAEAGLSGLREVTAVAPGVYGQTGVDVGELVDGLVRTLRPALIIALDAL
ncbi:MAG: GPR endopeptidase, partial [Candidatus Fimadaptatus sp.]